MAYKLFKTSINTTTFMENWLTLKLLGMPYLMQNSHLYPTVLVQILKTEKYV